MGRSALERFALINHFILLAATLLSADDARQNVVVVVGAPGTDEYREAFLSWAGQWKTGAQEAGAALESIGLEANKGNDRELLRQRLLALVSESSEPLWLVLIGHGTYDGRRAKFNLRGPDITASELGAWLQPCKRPLAIVNCASASGPFVNRLAAPNRVIVTATRSGSEHNYARFGQFMAAAIADPDADLDKDQQTSLLEAFLMASARVAEFYENDARLATEHALIDDNGDGLGTQADWFRGVRATRAAKDGATIDGLRANQFHLVRSHFEKQVPGAVRVSRDDLERQIAQLRDQKAILSPDVYYRRLELIAIELAELYRKLDRELESSDGAAK